MLYNIDVWLWENLPYGTKLTITEGHIVDSQGDAIGRFRDDGHAADTLRAAGFDKISSYWIKQNPYGS